MGMCMMAKAATSINSHKNPPRRVLSFMSDKANAPA